MQLSKMLRTALLSITLAGAVTTPASTRAVPQPAPDADATPWTTGTYVYDGSGNIQSIGADEFRYDAYGRIVTSTVSGTTQSFAYDRYGNLVSITTTPVGGTASTISLQPNAANNRLPHAGPHVSATYDASGRVTYVRDMTGSWDASFEYDALDSVVYSDEPSPRIHLYTASDERIATIGVAGSGTAGSEWTLRDPSAKVLRRLSRSSTGTWRWVEDYVYLDGQLVASEVATPDRTLHFHRDHLGTLRLITNHMGARVALRTYSAFGLELPHTTQERLAHLQEPLQYTGHERDSPELDYMHARYYLPRWGRFLSADPVPGETSRPQSWNRYAYALNNPLANIDPTGMEETAFYCDDEGNCYQEITESALDYTVLDTTIDFLDLMAYDAAAPMLHVLTGLYNDDPTQIAIGYAGQLAMAAPGGAISGATRTLGSSGLIAGGFHTFAVPGRAVPATAASAQNVMNGVRLAQQLALESAESAFTASGGLSPGAISGSTMIQAPGTLGNPAIPSGFGKFATETFQSPSGPFQVHYYMNPTTGQTHYWLDYKVIFNVAR